MAIFGVFDRIHLDFFPDLHLNTIGILTEKVSFLDSLYPKKRISIGLIGLAASNQFQFRKQKI